MHTFKSIKEILSYNENSWEGKTFTLQSPDSLSESLLWRTEMTRDPIYIEEQDNFIIDGGTQGITIYGTSLILRKCENVTLRNLTIRLGAKGLTRDIRTNLKDRFKKSGYNGEALKLDRCKKIIIENCSFSWGLDETLSIENSENIKIRKSIISYPLNKPVNFENNAIWEEGEDADHAYAASNISSRDITYSRCIFAYSIKRNPQFSVSTGDYTVDATVRHCIIYGYTDEGTKFQDSGDVDDEKFKLRIHDNYYSTEAEEEKAIYIEKPKNKSTQIKVDYWRNVIGTSEQFKPNSSGEVSARKIKPTKTKTSRKGKFSFDEKHKDEKTPSVPFATILNEAGPLTPTQYTENFVKRFIRNGTFPFPNENPNEPNNSFNHGLLTGHEPKNFKG